MTDKFVSLPWNNLLFIVGTAFSKCLMLQAPSSTGVLSLWIMRLRTVDELFETRVPDAGLLWRVTVSVTSVWTGVTLPMTSLSLRLKSTFVLRGWRTTSCQIAWQAQLLHVGNLDPSSVTWQHAWTRQNYYYRGLFMNSDTRKQTLKHEWQIPTKDIKQIFKALDLTSYSTRHLTAMSCDLLVIHLSIT